MSTEAIMGIAISGVIGAILVGTLIFKAGGWHSRVNADLSVLNKFMDEIRTDIKTILFRIPNPAIENASPRRLTKYGRDIAQCLGASAWAAREAPEYAQTWGALEASEVDAQCDKVVASELDADMIAGVRRCAYKFGIDQEIAQRVLQVVLRDAVLAIIAAETPSTN